MVMEFLLASIIGTSVAFRKELSGKTDIPKSTERVGREKELLDEYYKAYEKKQYKQAIKYIEEAVNLDPDYPLYYFWVGNCYFMLAATEEENSEEHCRIALEYYKHVLALQGRVYVVNDMKLLAFVRKQIETLERALEPASQISQGKKIIKKRRKTKPEAYVWREDIQKYRCEHCMNTGRYHYCKTLKGIKEHIVNLHPQ